MRRTLRTAVATPLLVILGATLAACSLSEAESDLARGLTGPLDEVDLVLTREDATCVAETWVGEIGTEPFVEDGLANARLQVRVPALRRALAGRHPVSRATAELGTDLWHEGLAARLTGRDSSRLDRARLACEEELR